MNGFAKICGFAAVFGLAACAEKVDPDIGYCERSGTTAFTIYTTDGDVPEPVYFVDDAVFHNGSVSKLRGRYHHAAGDALGAMQVDIVAKKCSLFPKGKMFSYIYTMQ